MFFTMDIARLVGAIVPMRDRTNEAGLKVSFSMISFMSEEKHNFTDLWMLRISISSLFSKYASSPYFNVPRSDLREEYTEHHLIKENQRTSSRECSL